MAKITQRDIAESVAGLQKLAHDLQAAASESTPKGAPKHTVLVSIALLKGSVDYLQTVSEELLTLIPEKQVVVPK